LHKYTSNRLAHFIFFVSFDCRPPNADGNCTGINSAHFSIALVREVRPMRPPAGPACATRPNVNGCPRYDIYFIGVSLPSSMMIYNCCRLNCNYYNYRFFIRESSVSLGTGPDPDALFAPSPCDSTPLILPFPLGTFLRSRSLFRLSVCRSRSYSPLPPLAFAAPSTSRTETRSTAAPS